MDVPQSRSISERDVYTFISVAPPHVLRKMQDKIIEKLNENSDTEYMRGVMRAHMNNAVPPQPPTPISAPPPGVSPAEDAPFSNLRDRLMQMSRNIQDEGTVAPPSSAYSSPGIPVGDYAKPNDNLMNQFNAMPKASDDNDLKDIPAEFTFISTDNYGDGLVNIEDPELVRRLESKMQECKANNWYFPFAMKGPTSLKIKKFRRNNPGERCRGTLTFSRWERDGKIGYSCWAK